MSEIRVERKGLEGLHLWVITAPESLDRFLAALTKLLEMAATPMIKKDP